MQGCSGFALLVTVLIAVLITLSVIAGAPQTDEQWRILAEVQRLRIVHGTLRVALVLGACLVTVWLLHRWTTRRRSMRYLPDSPQFDALFRAEGGYYVDNRPVIEGRVIRYLEVDSE